MALEKYRAKKSRQWVSLKKHPSGAKAHFDIAVFMYGLKPVPFN
jgi:hypothetical protein